MIDTSASRSIRCEVSTSLPSTLPASAARASPGPIACATSATVTAPPLPPRIVAVRHGFEDHVRAGNHVLTARDKVAHGRAARALAHRRNVLGYELVQGLWIGTALALVRRKRRDHSHATGLDGQHVFLAPGVEVDRNIRRRESDRDHDEQNGLA